MSVALEKNKIRKAISQLKKGMSDAEKEHQSMDVFSQLENRDVFKNAIRIGLYWSLADEVITHAFILKWQLQKEIYLPVIIDKELEFRRFEGENTMVADVKFGVLQPKGEKIVADMLDLVIVPGVAFDTDKNRMGRGGGFYDRVLPQMANVLKIGVAFNVQKVPQVPTSPHDIPMDDVIFGT